MVGSQDVRSALTVPADERVHNPTKAESYGLLPHLCEYIYQFMELPSIDKDNTTLMVDFVEISLHDGKVV